MLKIRLISIGKTKESWLDAGIQEYVTRLKSTVQFEFIWAKDNQQLIEIAKKESGIICLDPEGMMMNSETFSKFLQESWEKEGSRLTIIIGGHDGLPAELKKKGKLLSLSQLTFTHQMTRIIILEQIYRALEIQKGSSYHK